MATPPEQHPVGLPADGRAGIGWGYQQPYLVAHGQIVEVVADEGGAGWCRTQLLLELGQCSGFVFDPHQAVVNAQLPGPHFGGSSFAAAQERQLQTGLLQQADAQTIAHIKPFL